MMMIIEEAGKSEKEEAEIRPFEVLQVQRCGSSLHMAAPNYLLRALSAPTFSITHCRFNWDWPCSSEKWLIPNDQFESNYGQS